MRSVTALLSGMLVGAASLGVLLYFARAEDYPPPPYYCSWAPGPECYWRCDAASACDWLCGDCVTVPDPVFVNKDMRDVSGLRIEKRAQASAEYREIATRLADEVAAAEELLPQEPALR